MRQPVAVLICETCFLCDRFRLYDVDQFTYCFLMTKKWHWNLKQSCFIKPYVNKHVKGVGITVQLKNYLLTQYVWDFCIFQLPRGYPLATRNVCWPAQQERISSKANYATFQDALVTRSDALIVQIQTLLHMCIPCIELWSCRNEKLWITFFCWHFSLPAYVLNKLIQTYQ